MLDPFEKRYETCSKCGGRLGTRTESATGGSFKTYQVCRKCSHQILTAEVNVIKDGKNPNR